MVCTRTLIAVGGALANLVPGRKEEVLNEAKIEEIVEEKERKEKSMTSKTATAAAGGGGEARKRTNAKAASVSEKQDL